MPRRRYRDGRCGGRPCVGSWWNGDRGAITAELAMALPALVLLLTVALGAVDAVADKMRCVDAARDAALESARGGDGIAAGLSRAPEGASVVVTIVDGRAIATVSMETRPLGDHVPGIGVVATAVAALEPGA